MTATMVEPVKTRNTETTLEPRVLETILQDMSFYTRCPEFLFLKGYATAIFDAQRREKDAKLNRAPGTTRGAPPPPPSSKPGGCGQSGQPGGCGQNTIPTTTEQLLQIVLQHLALMTVELPESGLDGVRTFIHEKFATRGPIIFYYRTPVRGVQRKVI
jgi:hypothetical protein